MNSSAKSELRKYYSATRRALPDEVISEKSLQLSERVMAELDWEKVKNIHCFLPLVGQNEPDVRSVIEYAIRAGKQVYASNPRNKKTEALESSLAQQVIEYDLSDAVQFEVIIIPMLAYDSATRHRLGFGGGFYDRLLAKQPQAYKLGVCFSECVANLPSEPHDVPLDDCFIA